MTTRHPTTHVSSVYESHTGAFRRKSRIAYLTFAALVPSVTTCLPQHAVAPSVMRAPTPGQSVYDTRISIDLETGILDARSTLSYVANENTAAAVGFLLNRELSLHGVRGAPVRSYHSVPFQPVPGWNLVEVQLDGVASGAVVTLEVAYSGEPELPSDNINGISAAWVELNLDSQWHPIFSTFDQEMTGLLRVELPSDWKVVASGLSSFEDAVHVIRNTVPQVDVAFVAAPSFESILSERFTVYFRSTDHRTASAVLKAAESCGSYLNQRYGELDTLPKGKLVLAERTGPGYARKNFIVLSQVDADDQVGLHKFLCHELAHYWTRSAGSFSPHHWMTEAFAEYVAGRYIREHFGQSTLDSLAAQWERVGRGDGPVWTPESSNRPSGVAMYMRAPHLLYRLEERIGTERFDRFLARYMVEDMRTTPELLDRLRDVAGGEAERWFREELASSPSRSAQ